MNVRTESELESKERADEEKPTYFPSSSTSPLPSERAPEEEKEPPLYYDVPMLKEPTWRWEIASYFFLGGLSAGAYLVARAAERFGGGRYRKVAKVGTAVAAASFLPCPPLLIKDLGDPKRFHHMLRVFKPISPMNVGTWALTGYGGALTLATVREWLARSESEKPSALLSLGEIAGIPMAVLMSSYTGVLLSTTSTPLWAKNQWLGPLFSASAIHNGAEAVDLVLSAGAKSGEEPAAKPMQIIKSISRVAEAITLGGYLSEAGKLSKPVTSAKYAPMLWGGAIAAGIVVPELLDQRAAKPQAKGKKWMKIAGAALGLLGTFALKWAIVNGGRLSADDPRAARELTKPRQGG